MTTQSSTDLSLRSRVRALYDAAFGFQSLRYLLVGSSMALSYAVALTLITASTGWPASLTCLGLTVIFAPISYTLNRTVTFRSANRVPMEFSSFVMVMIMNSLWGTVALAVLVDWWGLPTFILGVLIAAALPLMNYVIFSKIIFAQRR